MQHHYSINLCTHLSSAVHVNSLSIVYMSRLFICLVYRLYVSAPLVSLTRVLQVGCVPQTKCSEFRHPITEYDLVRGIPEHILQRMAHNPGVILSDWGVTLVRGFCFVLWQLARMEPDTCCLVYFFLCIQRALYFRGFYINA